MSLILQKDPIIEALCEFRFVPNENEAWNLTIPGRVFERVKNDFPKTEQQPVFEFQAAQTPDGPVANAQTGIGIVRFVRQDRSALLQIAPDFFSVNQLKPYRGWPEFKPLITENLEKYWQATQPRAIQRVALRYINHITLPPGEHHYEDFLNVHPQIPGGREQVWASWVQRVEIVREDLNAVVTFQAGSHHELAPANLDQLSLGVILDLTFAPIVHQPMSQDAVSDWLETAHTEIEKLFFQSITDQCRTMFEPIEQGEDRP